MTAGTNADITVRHLLWLSVSANIHYQGRDKDNVNNVGLDDLSTLLIATVLNIVNIVVSS